MKKDREKMLQVLEQIPAQLMERTVVEQTSRLPHREDPSCWGR